jgi:formylglycine-generating enzyme required for sulfatase activity
MSGNVWEWCLTKWRDDYSSPVDDSPKGNEARVLRGGAFGDSAGFVRCTSRSGLNPDLRLRNYGFRAARAREEGERVSIRAMPIVRAPGTETRGA